MSFSIIAIPKTSTISDAGVKTRWLTAAACRARIARPSASFSQLGDEGERA